MTISLRSVAENCLGLNRPFSLVRDFFGYPFYDNQQTFPSTLSFRTQARLAEGESFNLSIFLVGHENDFSGVVTRTQVRTIQFIIQRVRNIYAQMNMGVRIIYWRRIGTSAAGGYPAILNRAEAVNLADDFSGPNDGIDAFLVQSIGDAGGWCNQDGPCNKNSSDDLTGVVMRIGGSGTGSRNFSGILLAHELGHYLGLSSGNSLNNLMGQDVLPPPGVDELSGNSTGITNAQAEIIRSHCFVNPPC